jgi:hypothetical protein
MTNAHKIIQALQTTPCIYVDRNTLSPTDLQHIEDHFVQLAEPSRKKYIRDRFTQILQFKYPYLRLGVTATNLSVVGGREAPYPMPYLKLLSSYTILSRRV